MKKIFLKTNKTKTTGLVLAVVFLTALLIGCAGAQWSDMTTKDKAAVAMSAYIGAAMDYERDVKRVGLTKEHKKHLQNKKRFLDEAYPVIDLYQQYAETGLVPTLRMEQNILRLIDDFLLYPALGY